MMNKNDCFPIVQPIVVLIGPTAIGKTALSIELAQKFDFEIVSVDSMQVYRYMNIGTAKITKDEMQNIPHHLIDVVTPDESFDATLYEKLAITAIQDIIARGKKVLLTGGTGLYLRSLLNGLSTQLPSFPEIRKDIEKQLALIGRDALHEKLSVFDRVSAERIHKNDTHRLVRAIEIYQGTGKQWSALIEEHKSETGLRFPNILIIGLTCDREKLYERIGKRSHIMLESGLQKEVEGLLDAGYAPELKSMQSIGYSHMIKLLNDEWTKEEMLEYLTRDTRRYAKRQFTWFKKIKGISWIGTKELEQVTIDVSEFINNDYLTT